MSKFGGRKEKQLINGITGDQVHIPKFEKNKEIRKCLRILIHSEESKILTIDGPSQEHRFWIIINPNWEVDPKIIINHTIKEAMVDQIEICPKFNGSQRLKLFYKRFDIESFNIMFEKFPWFWNLTSEQMNWKWLEEQLRLLAVQAI